jgi:alcohol dehydrogenase
MKIFNDRVLDLLSKSKIEILADGIIGGAKPNSPLEDIYRIENYILHFAPDFIVAIGGGSTIDAVKAANVLAALGKNVSPEIDNYFGTGKVSVALKMSNKKLLPLIAISTCASSGSHLTKYANVTDPSLGQKKLIVDEAIIPSLAIFDYSISIAMPAQITIDGVLDTIAHCFEVFCGATKQNFEKTKEIAQIAIDLMLENTKKVIDSPTDLQARKALGLAADLGGYAIMIGGTSGAHLTSFSLVDIASHGKACAIMNPFYAVYYSSTISSQLKTVGSLFAKYGFIKKDLNTVAPRTLALTVAQAMMDFSKSINAPTKLNDLEGFDERYIQKALNAAKDPQLKMKLENMPVPMTSEDIDIYMASILHAAAVGNLNLVKEKNL